MATTIEVIDDQGRSFKCLYPRTTFTIAFLMQDKNHSHWTDWKNTPFALRGMDQKLLHEEVDDALNNIQNLGMA